MAPLILFSYSNKLGIPLSSSILPKLSESL